MIEISHKQARFLIRQGLDGRRLPEEQWSTLQLHLDGCAECRAYREQLSVVERGLQRALRTHLDDVRRDTEAGQVREVIGDVRLVRAARKKRRKVFVYFAATALVLMVLFGLRSYQLANPPQTQDRPAVTRLSPTATATPSVLTFRGVLAFAGLGEEDGEPANSEIYLFNPGSTSDKGQLDNLTQHPANDSAPAWSPDGEWLAFLSDRAAVEGQPPKSEVYLVHVSGTRLTRLTDEPDVAWNGPLSWSSDGGWIALTGQQMSGRDAHYIYLVPTNSRLTGQGGPRPLAFTRGAPGPAVFSPNSSALVYGAGGSQQPGLMLYDFGSGRFNALTEQDVASEYLRAGSGGEFEWSFDGDRIVYLADGPYDPATGELDEELAATSLRITTASVNSNENRPQVRDELETIAGTGEVRGLIPVPGDLANTVVYLRDETGTGCWTIHIRMGREGLIQTGVVEGLCVEGSLSRASWRIDASGDGRPWLVVPARRGGERQVGMYAVRLSMGRSSQDLIIERLADLPVGPAAGEQMLALQVRPESLFHMRVMPAEIAPHQPDLAPAALPDAEAGNVIFAALHGAFSQIYTARPDGSQLRGLTGPDNSSACPAWSPDGSLVAFLADDDRRGEGLNEIYLMDQNGSVVKRLSNPRLADEVDARSSVWQPSSLRYDCPVWSPDGETLASVYHALPGDYLVLLPVDGSEADYLRTNPILAAAGLAWSQDGQHLAFVSQAERGRIEILALEVASVASGTAQLLELAGSSAWGSVDGMVFTADGLAYVTSIYNNYDGYAGSLNWTGLDGSSPRQPIVLPAATLFDFTGRRHLSLLPDGRLAFIVHNRPDAAVKTRLVLIDPLTGAVDIAAHLEEIVLDAAWSPDGRWLAYAAESGLYVLDAVAAGETGAPPVMIYDGWVSQVDWR